MKIRVFLILSFIGFRLITAAQKDVLKHNTIYFVSSIFIEHKKNTLAKDKGHIVFDTKQKTGACFTSCNFIQLKYSVNKNDFKFTSIKPAGDPCPDILVGLEEDFKSILPKVTRYTCKGKDLVFFDNNDTLMIFYEKDISKK